MKCLFILGSCLLLTDAIAVSCSEATKWVPKIYANAQTKVYHNGHLYTNDWYAVAENTPAAGSPWTDRGECDPTTMGDPSKKVDCSSALLYTKGSLYPQPKTIIHHLGRRFVNAYWAGHDDIPGEAPVWEDQGPCDEATSSETPKGEEVDCTNARQWTRNHAYTLIGEVTHHASNLYKAAQSWSENDVPGTSGVWTFVGSCRPGTNSTGPYPNPNEMSPELESLLCSCCKGCAENRIGNVYCHDDQTEDTCKYTWCPKYNTFDEIHCATIKEEQRLSWYSKEIFAETQPWPQRVYIPYIDSGLASQPDIIALAKDHGVKHFIIAFITSEVNQSKCRGAFAGVIPFRMGPTAWNKDTQSNDYLYDKLSELRQLGGSITVSYGGANGIELADSAACSNVIDLKNAYKEGVDFLKLTHIDFDIEGHAYAKVQRETGWRNRFEAVKLLSQEMPELHVWWTLPILPSGLTDDGLLFVNDMMLSGVRWDLLNVMNMDYGDAAICPGDKMHECEVSAIQNLAEQLYKKASELGLLAEYNWNSVDDVYPRLGSTPMLGMNDLTHEVYSLEDARKSVKVWQSEHPIGVISNWSVQRDNACDVSYVSVECSSINVQAKQYEFLDIFAPYTHA